MVHDAAAKGFERRSGTYALARPTYHPAVLDAVATHIGRSAVDGPTVDLGAGTGISTRALADRGLDVVAVEPVKAMRDELRASTADLQVADGTAESMPFEGESAAAVVVAQAFHWFDHGPALDEIARVLRRGGSLITLWNVRDEAVGWMQEYTTIQDQVQGDTPRYRDMAWRRAIEGDARFGLVNEVSTPNPQQSSVEHTVGRFLSTSFIARLDSARQQELVDEIRAVVAPLGASFDFPYVTEAQMWAFHDGTAGHG